MPRVVGLDPGSSRFGACGLDDGALFLEWSCSTADLSRDPSPLLEILRGAAPLDLIAGPSGYGLPLVPIVAVGDREQALMLLPSPEGGGIQGLGSLLRALREARLPVVFTPGAVHLTTVPRHRKLSRVDIGTADKVCAAAAAVADQAQRLGLPFGETSFVLVEVGGAFTAVLTVDRGRIVSGQGGSSGPPGFRSAGALDAETACLLGRVGKRTVFSGGAASIAGDTRLPPEALFARDDEAAAVAREALVEGVLKAVAAELALVSPPREILLSGRLASIPQFRAALSATLSRLGPKVVDLAPGRAGSKPAALGAALIADGLSGGRYAPLVDALRLREARGTVLDHLHLDGSDDLRTRWLGLAS
jgi:predicted butyrate kinase (DUF1464 family)